MLYLNLSKMETKKYWTTFQFNFSIKFTYNPGKYLLNTGQFNIY